MDSLGKLFGSALRLKVLRLFFFNLGGGLTIEEVMLRAHLSREEARKEVALLLSAGVLRRSAAKKPRYSINPRFAHCTALEEFVRATTSIEPAVLLAQLRKAGNLRLVVLSGLFTGVSESKADILVVGDQLSERVLARTMHALEAEFGREVRYACFSTADFRYRLGVYDRLIRDIMDYQHTVLLDKIGL